MLLLKWQKGRQPRRLLCFSAAFFIAALLFSFIFGAEGDPVSVCLLSGAATFALIVAAALFLQEDTFLFLPLFVGLLAGWLWCCGFLWLCWQPMQSFDGSEGTVRLVLDEYAEGKTSYGVAFGTVTELDGTSCRLKVKVYLQDGSPELAPGDVLYFPGKFSAAERSWRQNLLQEGYFLTLSQNGIPEVYPGEGRTLPRDLRILSRRITLWIGDLLPGDEGALLSALISGDRTGFSQRFDSALTRSGLRHMTAVSGLHVSILAGFLIWFLGKRAGLLAAVPVSLLYAALTGFSPSVIRATVLLLFWSASFWLKEEKDSLTALAAALLLLIAKNPFSCRSAGLLLSFAATLGLILLSAPLNEVLVQPLRKIKQPYLRRGAEYVGSTAAATLAATLFTLPLNLLFFESVPLLSLLSNILVLWAVTLVMVLGIAILAVSPVFPIAAAKLATGLLFWPLRWMVRVTCWIGALPFAATDSANFVLAISCLLLLGAALFWRGKLLSGRKLLTFTVSVLLITAAFTAGERMLFGVVEIQNRNGQPVILVRSGSVSVLNCGSGSTDGADAAQSALSRWNISGLDTAICGSADYKTQGGLATLLETVPVERVLLPSVDGAVASHYAGYPVQCYSDSGTALCGDVKVQLLRAGERFATRLWTKKFSLLNLHGLKPEAALEIVRTYPCEADILLVDPSLLDAGLTFDQVRGAVQPREILLLKGRYSNEETTFYHGLVTNVEQERVQYRFWR